MNRSDRLKQYWSDVKAGLRQPPKRGERNGNVTRKVRCASSWVRRGELVLTVCPHGELIFREPGKRASYKLGLAEAFRMAVVITTNKIKARTSELKKLMPLGKARKQARKELL